MLSDLEKAPQAGGVYDHADLLGQLAVVNGVAADNLGRETAERLSQALQFLAERGGELQPEAKASINSQMMTGLELKPSQWNPLKQLLGELGLFIYEKPQPQQRATPLSRLVLDRTAIADVVTTRSLPLRQNIQYRLPDGQSSNGRSSEPERKQRSNADKSMNFYFWVDGKVFIKQLTTPHFCRLPNKLKFLLATGLVNESRFSSFFDNQKKKSEFVLKLINKQVNIVNASAKAIKKQPAADLTKADLRKLTQVCKQEGYIQENDDGPFLTPAGLTYINNNTRAKGRPDGSIDTGEKEATAV